ncbi:hypothetical protein D3C72_1782370 [compost metagenome]
MFGLINEGQAFTGFDVLLWGPAIDEQIVELGCEVGVSNLYITFVPKGSPEGQINIDLPVYIGVSPDI